MLSLDPPLDPLSCDDLIRIETGDFEWTSSLFETWVIFFYLLVVCVGSMSY